MADKGSTSALERKLAAEHDTGRSALRALRLAIARTAKNLLDLPLAVIGAKQARCGPEKAADYLADNQLLMLLDGDMGFAGVASLDGACISALIQQQTMGQVAGNATDDRVFTGTDAAMAEPFIQAFLDRAAELSDA